MSVGGVKEVKEEKRREGGRRREEERGRKERRVGREAMERKKAKGKTYKRQKQHV